MTDYDKMLVDLLNDKIRQWERKCSEQRKEINKLKAEIGPMSIKWTRKK